MWLPWPVINARQNGKKTKETMQGKMTSRGDYSGVSGYFSSMRGKTCVCEQFPAFFRTQGLIDVDQFPQLTVAFVDIPFTRDFCHTERIISGIRDFKSGLPAQRQQHPAAACIRLAASAAPRRNGLWRYVASVRQFPLVENQAGTNFSDQLRPVCFPQPMQINCHAKTPLQNAHLISGTMRRQSHSLHLATSMRGLLWMSVVLCGLPVRTGNIRETGDKRRIRAPSVCTLQTQLENPVLPWAIVLRQATVAVSFTARRPRQEMCILEKRAGHRAHLHFRRIIPANPAGRPVRFIGTVRQSPSSPWSFPQQVDPEYCLRFSVPDPEPFIPTVSPLECPATDPGNDQSGEA